MKTRYNENYEKDLTPSSEIAQLCRAAIYDDDSDVGFALITYRGGEEEFLLGQNYSRSNDAGDRATGARILGQLGWGDYAFLDESVAILIELLNDSDPFVIEAAACALGHRSAPSAIPALISLISHSDSSVRHGVVFGLLGHEDDRAIAALIQLSRDENRDVRNWAVFGLGSLIDTDSPEIRDALRQALGDPDHEVRGEALVGLARRGDPTIVSDLLNEWQEDDVSILSLEAAQETCDSCLYEHLIRFTEILTLDDDPHFAQQLTAAIEACAPKQSDSVEAID